MPDNEVPVWACQEWGQEHDWLQCPTCQDEYEKWLERPGGYAPGVHAALEDGRD